MAKSNGKFRQKDNTQNMVRASLLNIPVYDFFRNSLLYPIPKLYRFRRRSSLISNLVNSIVKMNQYSPFYLAAGEPFAFPSSKSEIQTLINLGRYTNFHSDVIWSFKSILLKALIHHFCSILRLRLPKWKFIKILSIISRKKKKLIKLLNM